MPLLIGALVCLLATTVAVVIVQAQEIRWRRAVQHGHARTVARLETVATAAYRWRYAGALTHRHSPEQIRAEQDKAAGELRAAVDQMIEDRHG